MLAIFSIVGGHGVGLRSVDPIFWPMAYVSRARPIRGTLENTPAPKRRCPTVVRRG